MSRSCAVPRRNTPLRAARSIKRASSSSSWPTWLRTTAGTKEWAREGRGVGWWVRDWFGLAYLPLTSVTSAHPSIRPSGLTKRVSGVTRSRTRRLAGRPENPFTNVSWNIVLKQWQHSFFDLCACRLSKAFHFVQWIIVTEHEFRSLIRRTPAWLPWRSSGVFRRADGHSLSLNERKMITAKPDVEGRASWPSEKVWWGELAQSPVQMGVELCSIWMEGRQDRELLTWFRGNWMAVGEDVLSVLMADLVESERNPDGQQLFLS